MKNIIILRYKSWAMSTYDNYEAWGSMVEICKAHNLSYNYLKSKKFPFKYKEFEFIKVPFRKRAGKENE